MEGFEFFIGIASGVVFTILFLFYIIRKKEPAKEKKTINTLLLVQIALGLLIVGISLFVGGWTGMGYGLMGLSIIIGALVGGIITSVLRYVLNKKSEVSQP